jgi:modulator of FtsH protease
MSMEAMVEVEGPGSGGCDPAGPSADGLPGEGSLGSVGYAIRRDLSFLYRTLFWLLLVLIAAGIVLIFVRIPAAYTVYALAGLAIFGLYTVVDFNRLRHAGTDEAIPLAAGIFLDVLNIFLLFLRLFSRSS